MKFVCDEHGEVFPSEIWYSFPSTAKCPLCGKELIDRDKSMDTIEFLLLNDGDELQFSDKRREEDA